MAEPAAPPRTPTRTGKTQRGGTHILPTGRTAAAESRGVRGPLEFLPERVRRHRIDLGQLAILPLIDRFEAARARVTLERRGDWLATDGESRPLAGFLPEISAEASHRALRRRAAQRQARGFSRLGCFALDDQPECQRGFVVAERRAQVHLVRAQIGRQTLQIADQIERFVGRGGQAQRVPTQPDDEVGGAAALCAEAPQHRRPGVIAITDADFARQRRATLQGFAAMLVGQFQMREPAASEIEHAVDAPVGARAAGFAHAGAVGEAQGAAGPTQLGAGRFRRKQSFHQHRKKVRRLVQPVFHPRIAEVGDPQHGRPGRRLAQRQPARPARQRDPQQGRTIDHLALALDRLGLQRQTIEVEAGGKPLQQLGKLVCQNRCCVLHLPPESSRAAPGQQLF